MEPGWQIKHQRFGWGVLVTLGTDGRHIARFSDGADRHVRADSIIESRPPQENDPRILAWRAPANPHLMLEATRQGNHELPEPTRRELQAHKDAVKELLEAGKEADADMSYASSKFLRAFWPEATYAKHKEDQHRRFQKQISRAAEHGDLESATETWSSCCAGWLPKGDFRRLVLEGLVAGEHWSMLRDFATTEESQEAAIEVLWRSCLAVDIESDGEQVWEIGVASADATDLILSRTAPRDQLQPALAFFTQRMGSARLVVGHNVLGWDWPIIARSAGITSEPLIWDTLLVQYVLQPQAISHALGGSHRADSDARAALHLFAQQLRCFPSAALAILAGEITTTTRLLVALTSGMSRSTDYSRKVPEHLHAAIGKRGHPTLMPERLLRAFDWVPGVVVICADPSAQLEIPWLQINVSVLDKYLSDGEENGPAAQTVLTVAHMAAMQGIPIRRNMIPPWLLESDPRLKSAVNAASFVDVAPDGTCIASLPASPEWWAGVDPADYTIVGLNHDVLVLGRQHVVKREDTEGVTAPFMRIGSDDLTSRWSLIDRPALLLEPEAGYYTFATLPLDLEAVGNRSPAELTHRPILAARRHHVLHPGAEDQAIYWAEVLRTVRETSPPGATGLPILLVGSSRSKRLLELLATGLSELGLGEVKAAHHSQRDHLLRAALKGHILVDAIDRWPSWYRLAQSVGITLLPVVESLPLEEWYACAESRVALRDKDDGNSPTHSRGELGGTPINASLVLERSSALIEERLYGWLSDLELASSELPVVLIDPRGSAIGRGLSRVVEMRPLDEGALSTDEAQRLAIALSPLRIEREEAPADPDAMERFLVANWQPPAGKARDSVTGFKPSQRAAIETICERRSNVLVSLPTGEGKSVLFQVPALCRGLRNRRLSLVLSPLKALMRDQVERLRQQGFSDSVDYISGDRPTHEIAEVIQGLLDHRIVLLYIAPERMRSEAFLNVLHKRMLADQGLDHLVVDEAHCVNQWGFEFRPDYFHALELALRLCHTMDSAAPTPFVLLSATLTAYDRLRLRHILEGASEGTGSKLPTVCIPDSFANPLRDHIRVQPQRVRGQLSDRREFDRALAERMPFILQTVIEARRNRARSGQRSAVLVFVSNRRHAEIVAQRVSREAGGNVDYYHAGLDAITREEIYTRFLDDRLDVLVATKAFGMGMDIPDIHWVIHLGPPSYLEDYLQEVGRIGRGVQERKNAGLERLNGVLLFSDRDFESIRSARARSALSLPFLKELYRQVLERAIDLDGQRAAVVPSEGYGPAGRTASARRAQATRVRMALYWLERAGYVRLCGSVPNLIALTIHPSTLQRIAGEPGALGDIAALILQVEASVGSEGVEQPHDRPASGGTSITKSIGGQRKPNSGILEGLVDALGGLLSGLADTIGVLLGRSSGATTTVVSVTESPQSVVASSLNTDGGSREVILNLSQMKLRSSAVKSIGDLLGCLADLERRGGVSLSRNVQIVPRPLATESPRAIDSLLDRVDKATAELLRRLATRGKVEFTPFEMLEEVESPEVQPQQRQPYESAFINGFRSLARACGVRLRQIVRDDDKVLWEGILAPSDFRRADLRRKHTRAAAQALFKAVRGRESVPISTIIQTLMETSPDRRFRESGLTRATGLLAAMSLVSVSPALVELSHVVMLPDVEGDLDGKRELWDELRLSNDLAEARNLAMEVFANVDPRAHPTFIEGYFGAADVSGIRTFLEGQLGEITTETGEVGAPGVIADMREKLRATRALEFFSRFEQSPEPVQWEAVRHPFDRHAIVNAGPGAGKTLVLVGRIAHLIRQQGVDPSQIVVLAFNRAVVFEIRRRIRELFASLGYASYAARLRVSTFHSFAIKSLSNISEIKTSRSDMDGLITHFSAKMMSDTAFRRSVAGNVRSILIDEFQDANDHVYAVIHGLYLGSGGQAGVMVIGDDDQDILRWQRLEDESRHQFSEEYFERFEHDFGGGELSRFFLGTNFRSAKAIVRLSQSTISSHLGRNSRSRRLKASELNPGPNAVEGVCEPVDWRGRSWEGAVGEAARLLIGSANQEAESVAVLCRSNAEVAEAYRLLAAALPGLTVQGSANLRVREFRHVGLWLDHLRTVAAREDRALSEELKREVLDDFSRSVATPEFVRPETASVQLRELWSMCSREQPFPQLSSLIRFVEELQSDDFGRLAGLVGSGSTAVVSTLHKVKGLEFDNVVVLPSLIPFGAARRGHTDLLGDAAEEARLQYVGMTRAKRRLWYFEGDREACWAGEAPVRFDGRNADGRVLTGSLKDVRLSWCMQRTQFNPAPDRCQSYIESEVAIGDPVTLGGYGMGAYKALMHQGTHGPFQVGFLAMQHGAGGPGATLRVSAVVRFRPDEMDETFADVVRERGWGYVVLVSGRLR